MLYINPPIPEGWRVLNIDEETQEGDKWLVNIDEYPTNPIPGNKYLGLEGAIIIRPV